jgi:hypothetical protein
MEACPECKETLLLDVCGELDSKASSVWEAHVKTCAGCREERVRMLRLIGRMKETMSPPPLTPRQTETLIRAVRSDLREHKEARWWGGLVLGRPSRLLPAMATFCVLVIALSVFGLRTLHTPSGIQSAPDQKAGEELVAEDLEVIEHLDLLKDMDWVHRLVQVIDETDSDVPDSETHSHTQGMIRNEHEGTYA